MENERGSVMLVILLMIVILSVLGMSVLAASIGGGIRSETRQNDVQSLHLAEKALNEAIAQIVQSLDDVPYDNVDSFEAKIRAVLGEMKSPFATSLGKNVHVEYSVTEESSIDTPLNPSLYYRFKVQATASVNGVTRTLAQIVTIDAFPDFLNYAIGSTGPVIINGSPYIIGSVYAGEGLHMNNRAEYRYLNVDKAKMTVFPTIVGGLYVSSSNHIKGYKCYTEDPRLPCEPESHLELLDLLELITIEPNKIEIELVNPAKFIEVDVGHAFVDKINEATGTIHMNYNTLIPSIQYEIAQLPTHFPGKFVENDTGIFTTEQSTSVIYNGDLILDGNNLMETINSSNPDQIVARSLVFTDKNKNRNWLIVNGDLDIDNRTDTPIHIDANILVRGNVYISGEINFDSTIIALNEGQVDPNTESAHTQVSDASIGGIEDKSLVLLSKGMIKVTRVNEFEDITSYHTSEPDVLKAFFYTEGKAVLYGVGSVFRIHGGFFARESLEINALRGNTKETETFDELIPEWNQDQYRDQPDMSRFVVEYNKNVFKQDNGLPRIKQINVKIDPKILESKK